jgi:hypothetical protein
MATSWSSHVLLATVEIRAWDQTPADSTSANGPLSSPMATHVVGSGHEIARIDVGWGLEIAHGATHVVHVVAATAAGAATTRIAIDAAAILDSASARRAWRVG